VSRRGFTLVEVLVAMAITAVIGAMVVGTFAQVNRANEIVRDQGDRYASSRMALTRMARELTMAFVSDHYDRTTTNAYRERPTLFVGREDSLLFTTFAHERTWLDARESDQAVVQYELDDDPAHRDGKALFRREKLRIDADADRGGRRDLVADHVRSVRFQYWDMKRNEWVREWSTRSIDRANELPLRVRIELETTLADGRPEKFTTEARIAMTRPLEF
jgi:general secretion pathway protein J